MKHRRKALKRLFAWASVGATAGVFGGCKTPQKQGTIHRSWSLGKNASLSLLAAKSTPHDVIESLRIHLPLAQSRIQEFALSFRGHIGLTLYDDGFDFSQQTGRTSSALRAWSTKDRIHLLLVDEGNPADRSQVLRERFTHELCHVALFQSCPPAALPAWWQEGVASVVAQQERRRLTVAQLRGLVKKSGNDVTVDLLYRKVHSETDAFFRYALAHHVVQFCVVQAGPTHVARIAEELSRGETLKNVFHIHIGYSLAEVVTLVLRS